jgi:predicted alpha/beta-hydrolase family hydrolase
MCGAVRAASIFAFGGRRGRGLRAKTMTGGLSGMVGHRGAKQCRCQSRGQMGYSEIRNWTLMPHQRSSMNCTSPERLTIAVKTNEVVSGLLLVPERQSACFVLAHGAGAGMTHPFMASIATGLCERGIATLRYQFPYMEKGSRRPDPPSVAQAAVRAAVAEARARLPSVPLFAGGKSFGGRMTSQAQAAGTLSGVLGLGFLGFPLHPAGKPSISRAEHLRRVDVPMLFLQGTRDALADPSLIQQVTMDIGQRASLAMIADADHSFHVPARTGRTDAEVRTELLDLLAAWMNRVVAKVA